MIKALIIFVALLLLNSCASYKLGPDLGGHETIKLTKVDNASRDPKLAAYTASKVRTEIVSDGSLKLVESDSDLILDVNIVSYKIGSAGSTLLESTDNSQRRYVSSIRRVTVELNFTLKKANGEVVLKPRKVTGTSEFSDLNDFNLNLQGGLKQAVHDASKKIISGIVHHRW